MSSKIDTLLQAALYLELQEQRRSHELSPSSVSSTEIQYQYHDSYYDNAITRNRNNSHNQSTTATPQESPVTPILNGINNNYNGSNSSSSSSHHDYPDCTVIIGTGSMLNEKLNHARIVEPCSNVHSVSTSYTMIPTPATNSQLQSIIENEMHYIKNDSDPITVNNNNNVIINNNYNNNINENNKNSKNNDIHNNSNSKINNNNNDNNNSKTNLSRSLPTSAPLSPMSSSIILNFDDNRIKNNHNNMNAISTLSSYTTPTIHSRKKFIPLTPPPIASRKLFETSRIRSFSLSSNKITAANLNGSSLMSSASSSGTSKITQNGSSSSNNVLSSTTEDSSQSSLNLSTSGYLSGGSANSSVGGCSTSLNLNGPSPITANSSIQSNNLLSNVSEQSTTTATGRRRTISSNSNGAGTREVHNKLEKYRRAHLKECFEQLKVHLDFPKDEEKKKTSNLAILAAAYQHVMALKTKERELEQTEDRLANEKVNAQKKIISLKRELGAKYVNIDFSSIISDTEVGNIPTERAVTEILNDSVSLSSGRGSMRYSSSSSLSSGGNTVSSPLSIQSVVNASTTISPVISSSSVFPSGALQNSSPNMKSLSPFSNSSPLSLTARNISATSLTRGSPTPSTPSPSPSSSGVSSSSSMISTSPPISIGLKLPNIPNGVKYNSAVSGLSQSTASTISIVSSSGSQCSGMNSLISSPLINISNSETKHTMTTSNGMPLNFNGTSQNLRILPNTAKEFNGKNGVCRKASSLSESRDSLSPSLQHVVLTSGGKHSNFNCVKDMAMEDGEHPPKVIKVFNGIALAAVDKESKILSPSQMPSAPLSASTQLPLTLSQVLSGCGLVVSPLTMANSSSHPGFNVIGTNGVATIELSSSSQSRVHTIHTSSPPVTSVSGAQLHKLLVNGTANANSIGSNGSGTMAQHNGALVASELGRLPGGAEVNILPTATNGTTTLYRANGKLAIVNNGLTLKGMDHMSNGTARSVHVVTPIHSANSLTSLTPIVVSQGQQANNLAHLIASSPQLAGKVNLSVGGQTLPLLNTQYLGPMKPMVVTVASNSNPTLSSVSPMRTSANIVTGTTNGNTS